ncbi:DUF134 domain-containing protein [Methanococcoides sp.]|jgi:predicted DNA-binding protein (UPF0251 family)/predicted RNA-binding Zn-ribbon protein involved in translation (DUF1610 family)|uniref:DUF134 domain-containing protein n=1 Tax=Methanococcoides sp. TaxID=1966350 RepID=UPI0019EFE8D8|nr:DUF134 domain-containing protein [Methanococcoides sp.]NOQ48243.1 DUF134 domain-containing protein [Methanococcoides sp.]
MGRPRKRRMVNYDHNTRHFKPSGVCLKDLEEVNITIDELETLRLSSLEKMKQENAAQTMQIHQSTFQRTLQRTLQKIADALVNGKSIKVEGGNYTMPGKDGTGPMGQGPMGGLNRGQNGGMVGGQTQGRGQRGLRGGKGAGVSISRGECKCPNCGHEQIHQPGIPCGQINCPKCGNLMIRK